MRPIRAHSNSIKGFFRLSSLLALNASLTFVWKSQCCRECSKKREIGTKSWQDFPAGQMKPKCHLWMKEEQSKNCRQNYLNLAAKTTSHHKLAANSSQVQYRLGYFQEDLLRLDLWARLRRLVFGEIRQFWTQKLRWDSLGPPWADRIPNSSFELYKIWILSRCQIWFQIQICAQKLALAFHQARFDSLVIWKPRDDIWNQFYDFLLWFYQKRLRKTHWYLPLNLRWIRKLDIHFCVD